MTTSPSFSPTPFSRRLLLGGAAGTAALGTLSACSKKTSSGSEGQAGSGDTTPIKMWDMPYGNNKYAGVGKDIAAAYAPGAGLAKATYQSIPWDGWLQTYSAAIASRTEPSLSTGGTYQVIPFYDQGAIAPADNVIKTLKDSGVADDYADGVLEMFTYQDHVVSVPWMVDVRLFYYRKSLLRKAGVEPPATWDDLLTVGRALKKIGVIGFGIAGTNSFGPQVLQSMLVNNGGGFFNDKGEPDCLNDRNLESVEFLLQLSREGIMDPDAVGQNGDYLNTSISNGKIGAVIHIPFLESLLTPEAGKDIGLTSPLKAPHGDQGTVSYFNNIMMYQRTTSLASTEAFLVHYLTAIKKFWQAKVITGLPLRKSFAKLPEFASNANAVKAYDEWIPVSKWMGAQASKPFPEMNSVDGGQALTTWCQEIIIGKKSAQDIQQTLQDGIEQLF